MSACAMRAASPVSNLPPMNLTLLAFFTMWARPCAPVLLPDTVFIEEPWEVHIHNAWACDHLYQVVESVYLPHGGTLNYVTMLDGERVWNAPNPWLSSPEP
jgi:hypothetical protein